MNQPLLIKYPSHFNSEFLHSLNVVLKEFLGLKYITEEGDFNNIEFSLHGSQSNLTLDASFFNSSVNNWLDEQSMPSLPLKYWVPSNDGLMSKLCQPSIPVIFGSPGIDKKGNNWHLNIDIFGSIFFMISRYEEGISSIRDNHNRFPAHASISAKSNFLERPIVDEYVEIIWSCIHALWPTLDRKKRVFKKFITCDVDLPFDPLRLSLFKTLKRSASDIIKRKSIKLAAQKWRFYFASKFNIKQPDECRDMVDWIMAINEKLGNKVAFYFITESTSNFDLKYNFDSKNMRMLFKEIYDRGHEIGLHPGYECYKNKSNFKNSVSTLKKILKEECIDQAQLGGRMHYLRWDSTKTPSLWDSHGFHYDSTLSYAEVSGFRCGTSHEFTMFDLKNRSSFKLKQRPLINMECTIISDGYEGLGYSEEAFERFRNFSDLCKKYDGNYTLLWHNTSLGKPKERSLYLKVLNHN
jgi:hypothetical protein